MAGSLFLQTKTPLRFLTTVFAGWGMLAPVTRDALIVQGGEIMSRSDIAVCVLMAIGAVMLFAPVMRAAGAIGARGLRRAGLGALALAAATYGGNMLTNVLLGDVRISADAALTATVSLMISALGFLLLVMIVRPQNLEPQSNG